MENAGTLSVVATPIGNMEDITLRAIRVLSEADYVLAEDTRVTGKLLKRHGIETTLRRYDAHASDSVHASILADLQTGMHIALVSDAGTPGISDPGVLLVARAREAGAGIEAIPGPSAVTAAFSIAGITGNQFSFLGFAPQKKGRETFFREMQHSPVPVIFFESTHRMMKTLTALDAAAADAPVVVLRELTKIHEEVVRGTAAGIRAYFEEHPEHQRGEFIIIVAPTGGGV